MSKFIFIALMLCCFGMQSISSIEPRTTVTDGYDVHTYFDVENKDRAHKVYQNFLLFLKREGIEVATSGFYPEIFDRSPHPKPMWEVDFKSQDKLFEKLGVAISWLMLNRDGLSVLVHPNTGKHTRESKIQDHTIYTLWMGPPVNLNVDPEIFDDETLIESTSH